MGREQGAIRLGSLDAATCGQEAGVCGDGGGGGRLGRRGEGRAHLSPWPSCLCSQPGPPCTGASAPRKQRRPTGGESSAEGGVGGLEGAGAQAGISLSIALAPGRTGRLEPNPSPTPSSLGSPHTKTTSPTLFVPGGSLPLKIGPPLKSPGSHFRLLPHPPHPHPTILGGFSALSIP